jgi:hypothetical protein
MRGNRPAARRALRAACVLWALSAPPLHAADLVVVSLVGTRLTVVTPGLQTGTHLDPNEYTVVALPEPTFDDTATEAAKNAVRAMRPAANVVGLRAEPLAGDAAKGAWLRADAPELRSIVERARREAGIVPGAQLLAVLPYRDAVTLASYSGYRGQGTVAGLGFYVGGGPVNRDPIPGFLGVFANMQLVLVDLGSSAILAQRPVVAGETYSAARWHGVWDALPGARRGEALAELLRREIGRALPAMIAVGGAGT